MFVELGALGTILYGYNRIKNSDIYNIKKDFNKVMQENKTDYYKILAVNKNTYGYNLIINLDGRGFVKLESTRDLLESKFSHMVSIEQNRNLKTATISVITEDLTDTTKFTPVKISPYEIYAGLDYKFKSLMSNMNKFPHVLVSGQTGSGKTEIIRILLTNLIYNFSERDLNIYFSDLSDMCDFDIFKNCKQTKGYSINIEQSVILFDYLIHIYEKRLDIFSKNTVKNIVEYNKNNYSRRMSYVYLVLDEFADYFPVNKFEKNYSEKVKCYNLLRHMVRKFRKTGIFLIIGIQRPDTTVLDPSLKSGLCTKIAFSQNTASSSLVACDTTELANVENRKGLFMYGNKREWFKSLYIDDKLIKEYIRNSLIENRVYLPDYNKFLNKKINSTEEIIPEKKKSKNKVKIK